jgi:hypothetical protein
MHNALPHDLYFSGDQVKEAEVGMACGTYGMKQNAYRVLVTKSEGKRLLGRPRHGRG